MTRLCTENKPPCFYHGGFPFPLAGSIMEERNRRSRYMPRSCHACAENAWSLHAWQKGKSPKDTGIVVPFRCKSWRHAGACARWKASQDFARCHEALTQNGRRWVYMMVTFAQQEWKNPIDQYLYGSDMWYLAKKMLEREYGKIRYIQTWERHKRPGSHFNNAIECKGLFERVNGDKKFRERNACILPILKHCGFGEICWVERMRCARDLARYISKLSHELIGAELKGQVPFDAPPHFRRLRASRGILPPAHKGEEWTGRMIFCPTDWAESIALGKPIPVRSETELQRIILDDFKPNTDTQIETSQIPY